MSLAEFERAPTEVQAQFWAAIRRATDQDHVLNRRVQLVSGVAPRGYLRLERWDQRWRDRCYRVRMREERGLPDSGFDATDAERLKATPASDYVEELALEEVPRSRLILCPLPGHEERTPSFHVRDTTWWCYGCGEHGSIYDLAAALWGLQLRGRDFLEVHKRLMERFG